MREPAAQAKQGHGNVKAQSFIAPHKPLDEIVDPPRSTWDLIGECIVQFGGTGEATLRSREVFDSATDTPSPSRPSPLMSKRSHPRSQRMARRCAMRSIRAMSSATNMPQISSLRSSRGVGD